jgi:hypothetical protein
MELLQCVMGPNGKRRSREDDAYAARSVRSADRALERRLRDREHVPMEAAFPQRVRRQSLPAGHTATSFSEERVSATLPHQSQQRRRVDSSSSGSTPVRVARVAQRMPHWGSSLSLASDNSVSELTSRTLLPPPSPAQRRASTPTRAGTPTRQTRPSLPQMRVEVQSPSLADYLAKPRLVRTPGPPTLARPSQHHAKRLLAGADQCLRPNYRNLRLGNFMEGENVSGGELIPEMLRQYYLDTFLGSCDTCESATHVNPTSPIQRGM